MLESGGIFHIFPYRFLSLSLSANMAIPLSLGHVRRTPRLEALVISNGQASTLSCNLAAHMYVLYVIDLYMVFENNSFSFIHHFLVQPLLFE